jgi:catechol 2,3-dioxygenase-like lactoylglutathione lyase family enzyme
VKGIHHLGLAVEDLDDAVSNYERLFGAEVSGRQTSESQGVEAVALQSATGTSS